MTDTPLPANLLHLSSLYPSIAEVCRQLGINRQQFNKYLAGQSRPSRHNMRRICDFFGVSEWELLLDERRFADLVSVRRAPARSEALREPLRHIQALYLRSESLERYVGYYYRYFYSFGYPGRIIKSLAAIFERDGSYFWKNIEIMPRDMLGTGRTVGKYTGAAFYLGERIYIVEYESLMASSITQLTLYPSYSPRVDYLLGVQTGGPIKRGRKPAASFVLLEYLGKDVDLRRACERLGLFEEHELDDQITSAIRNRMPEGAYVFEAEQI